MLGSAAHTTRPDALIESMESVSQLRSLAISTLEDSYPMYLRLYFPDLPALTSLTLTRACMSPVNQNSLRQLSQLRSLSLIRCHPPSDTEDQQAFGWNFIPVIGSSLTRLTTLDLSHSTLLREEDFSPEGSRNHARTTLYLIAIAAPNCTGPAPKKKRKIGTANYIQELSTPIA